MRPLLPTWSIAMAASLAALLAVTTVSCSDSGKATPDKPSATDPQAPVIQAQQSVGPIRKGMQIQEVITALGEPSSRTGNSLSYAKSGLAVLADKNGVLRLVSCGDPSESSSPLVKAFRGRTQEGIGMNSSRADVVRAYGEPTKTKEDKPGHQVLVYSSQGLSFTIHNDKVHFISVSFPRE